MFNFLTFKKCHISFFFHFIFDKLIFFLTVLTFVFNILMLLLLFLFFTLPIFISLFFFFTQISIFHLSEFLPLKWLQNQNYKNIFHRFFDSNVVFTRGSNLPPYRCLFQSDSEVASFRVRIQKCAAPFPHDVFRCLWFRYSQPGCAGVVRWMCSRGPYEGRGLIIWHVRSAMSPREQHGVCVPTRVFS